MRLIAFHRLRSRLLAADGFTLIEGLVAAFVLVVGLMATLVIFNASRDQGGTAERDQTAVGLANSELEKIRTLSYANVGLSANPPGSGETAVLERVAGNNLEIRGEDLDGDGFEQIIGPATGVTGAVVPFTSATNVGGQPYDIYRFVSWRDEECPLLALDDGSYATSLLDVIHGTNGLDSRRTHLGATITSVLALGSLPVIGPLINGTLSTLINGVNGINPRIVNKLNTQIDPALDSLEGLLDDGIDLCDVDLSVVKQITDKMKALQTAITTLNTALNNLDAGLGQILTLNRNPLTILTSLVNLINGTINGLTNTAEDALDMGTVTTADDLITSINALQTLVTGLGADTEKNTKRITVAVVPHEQNGVGPFEPVWASTVITDPDEGLG